MNALLSGCELLHILSKALIRQDFSVREIFVPKGWSMYGSSVVTPRAGSIGSILSGPKHFEADWELLKT